MNATVSPTSPAVLLDVSGVSVRFGGLQALSDVSFDVRRGEILALIGPNGAGKSTLLNVLSSYIAPQSGEVRFKDRTISGLAPDAVNRLGLARTFQAAEMLTGMSVLDNVATAGVARRPSGMLQGLTNPFATAKTLDALRSHAATMLDLVGLRSLADRPAATLTAGQQRLVAVARALGSDAELILLDEPAAGLTTDEKKLLAEAIRRIRERGITVLFVEHDLAFVSSLADRLVVLNHGAVLAKGDPETVRRDPAVVAAYLGNTDVRAARSTRAPGAEARTDAPLLTLDRLSVRYGQSDALVDVSLSARRGEIVTLIGANGAGKSSLLKAIAGLVTPVSGEVSFGGASIARLPMERRTAAGIALAPEGRQLFGTLSVRDNLRMGAYTGLRGAGLVNLFRPRREVARAMTDTMDDVLAFFPRLKERIDQQAGTLSGGEGQMLAIGRALMSRPQLLMLDEPSFGLAPQVTREILESLPRLAERGITVLLVEQNAHSALQVADRGYVLVNGRIALEGDAAALLASPDIGEAYLGWQDPTACEAA
ncbi:branched-chain amino acid transport system ATP-binding protein [Paraburkholderia sp. GAS199]|uniref:ATP-binding cassette domain-containing protein n=1 Tax=Paraburkholderia sp. GAS199 TaxID=3035126 RepID=UPI003D230F77